ncbi:iron complex transport system ATP-binding protein [Candidatus Magnetomoraceae bacterium gMMP-15]
MLFEINKISFFYNDLKVLNALDLNLEPGKFYGIIGPNGCGKTTILDILVKHQNPHSGEVIFKGKRLSDYSKKQLSKHISLVPQNFYINFTFTAQDIVLMGRYPHIPRFGSPSSEDYSRVEEVMKKTDTYRFKNRFITELSGGERQRVIFARALAQDASVLILDEATSNLDIGHAISLLNTAAMDVKQKNKTIIAVFQDINLAAAFCEYLIFIKQGSIAFHGPTNDVLNEHTISSVFSVEAKVYYEPYSNSKQVVFKR